MNECSLCGATGSGLSTADGTILCSDCLAAALNGKAAARKKPLSNGDLTSAQIVALCNLACECARYEKDLPEPIRTKLRATRVAFTEGKTQCH